jgi:hypothetical protein
MSKDRIMVLVDEISEDEGFSVLLDDLLKGNNAARELLIKRVIDMSKSREWSRSTHLTSAEGKSLAFRNKELEEIAEVWMNKYQELKDKYEPDTIVFGDVELDDDEFDTMEIINE